MPDAYAVDPRKLRQRPGDQPLPVGNAREGAHDQLIAQLVARRQLGLERYGQLLQPHNGRDTGRDLVEELLDGAVYAQTLASELADLRGLLTAARLTVEESRKHGHGLPLLEAALDALGGRGHDRVDSPTVVNPTSALAAVLRARQLVAYWRRVSLNEGIRQAANDLEAALDGPDQ